MVSKKLIVVLCLLAIIAVAISIFVNVYNKATKSVAVVAMGLTGFPSDIYYLDIKENGNFNVKLGDPQTDDFKNYPHLDKKSIDLNVTKTLSDSEFEHLKTLASAAYKCDENKYAKDVDRDGGFEMLVIIGDKQFNFCDMNLWSRVARFDGDELNIERLNPELLEPELKSLYVEVLELSPIELHPDVYPYTTDSFIGE